jgi:hypothetical protein
VRGIKRKRTMKGSSIHPPPNLKEKGLESATKKITKKGFRKSSKRSNWRDTPKP